MSVSWFHRCWCASIRPLATAAKAVSGVVAIVAILSLGSLMIPEAVIADEPQESAAQVAEPQIAQPLIIESPAAEEVVVDAPVAQSPPVFESIDINSGEVRFSFAGASWRDVIKWIADEAGLALHTGDLPTGSFSYSDPNSFTYAEAIDRVNLFLLPQGYALVRSGQLLSVINLGDPRSMQQLDAIAELISVDELATRTSHDVVKCIFPLEEIDHEEAVQELNVLKLMTPPAVLAKTNQLMITDTVAKLKNVQAILGAFKTDGMDNGTVVKSFALKHVEAEDVLLVARPHMGLATGEMIGIDVSLSADILGKHIFVTGVEDKVKLLEGLVQAIDQPDQDLSEVGGEAELKSHLVKGGNVEMVYNVLQTLLAGKTVRLSMDETASSVVALAAPDVQAEIAETVAQLQADEAEFAVIQLKVIDPYVAVSLLEEMLDLSEAKQRANAGMEAFTRHGNSRGLEVMQGTAENDAPRIDADPVNRRLFVRAKKHVLEQIKQIVAELDTNGSIGSSDEVRLFPLTGKQAERTLATAAKFWRSSNPIVLYQTGDDEDGMRISERLVHDSDIPPVKTDPASNIESSSDLSKERWLTSNANLNAPTIRCQLTNRGVLMQSDDVVALDRFEQHLRTIAGPVDAAASAPVVFYLKYTKANDALMMLGELLDGGDAASEGETGSLVSGYVSSSMSSFLGSFVTSRDGTTTMEAGSITVVAEPRLNRLIAQGTTSDMQRIEDYLKIIDKNDSLTSIETHGTSHVIELVNTKAAEVAAVIRDAYVGRVASSKSQSGAAGGGGSPEQQREAAARAAAEAKNAKKESSKKGSSSPQPKDTEPKMTIAVHEPSNSLIVTASEQLFREVEKLAKTVDSRGEQMIEVVTPVNALVLESVLNRVLLNQESTTPTAPRGSSASPPSSRPQPPRGKDGR